MGLTVTRRVATNLAVRAFLLPARGMLYFAGIVMVILIVADLRELRTQRPAGGRLMR